MHIESSQLCYVLNNIIYQPKSIPYQRKLRVKYSVIPGPDTYIFHTDLHIVLSPPPQPNPFETRL